MTAVTRTITGAKRMGGTSIHREVIYAHPRAKVWRALTEPALMARWLMEPEGFAPVVGTRFVLRAKGAHRGWRGFVECEVLAVDAGRGISWTWVGDADEPPLTLTLALEDHPAGTRLVLDHEGFEGISGWLLARLVLGPGWSRMLERQLAAVVAEAA